MKAIDLSMTNGKSVEGVLPKPRSATFTSHQRKNPCKCGIVFFINQLFSGVFAVGQHALDRAPRVNPSLFFIASGFAAETGVVGGIQEVERAVEAPLTKTGDLPSVYPCKHTIPVSLIRCQM